MKFNSLLLVFMISLGVILTANSQEITGRAYYKSSSQVRISMDSTMMNSDQMAQIQASIKKQMDREYILTFNPLESTWKQIETLGGGPVTASSGSMTMIFNSGGADRTLYKNLLDQSFEKEEDLMGKEFLIKDLLESFDWELSAETKKIGNYLAQKATYTKIVESKQFSTGMAEMEASKDTTIQVVAWFTPEIQVSQGPENYFGLPGLILELQSRGRVLICDKIELNPSANPVKIERPKRGKLISSEEFKVLQEESMNQMMNRYQGKPGDGNRIEIKIGN